MEVSSTKRGSKLRRDTSLFIINRDTLRNHAGVRGGQHSFGEFQRDVTRFPSPLAFLKCEMMLDERKDWEDRKGHRI